MVWQKDLPSITEAHKCRHRVMPFLKGIGLDLGCGTEKVIEHAIGIDFYGKPDVKLDLTRPNHLDIFADNSFDYIFSSHCLEDFWETEEVLKEWWRVIKPGGYLILYMPHKDFYPRVGQEGANFAHKYDFDGQDILNILDKFANYELIRNDNHNENDEYSFELIVKKINNAPKVLIQKVSKPPVIKSPRALVIRYGAIGDQIMATVVLPPLKKDGYHITYNTIPSGKEILRENPYIDDWIIQERNAVPIEELGEYWERLKKDFDKFVNLSESVEKTLLATAITENYKKDKEERHRLLNRNYFDHQLEVAGYGHIKGRLPELYFTDMEEKLIRKRVREKYKNNFLICWVLSGSAWHKIYPYAEYVANAFLEKYKDAVIITVGDEACRLLEFDHPRAIGKSGILEIRQSLLLTKYADLVIGPETGVLNASGCFKTPKICLLTHSSKENLTKYWLNDFSMQSEAECSPCHKLVYAMKECPITEMKAEDGTNLEAPLCVEKFNPEKVFRQIERVYHLFWRPKCQSLLTLPNLPQYQFTPAGVLF